MSECLLTRRGSNNMKVEEVQLSILVEANTTTQAEVDVPIISGYAAVGVCEYSLELAGSVRFYSSDDRRVSLRLPTSSSPAQSKLSVQFSPDTVPVSFEAIVRAKILYVPIGSALRMTQNRYAIFEFPARQYQKGKYYFV